MLDAPGFLHGDLEIKGRLYPEKRTKRMRGGGNAIRLSFFVMIWQRSEAFIQCVTASSPQCDLQLAAV